LANVFYVQISRLQFIHSHNLIHCDFKPSNLVMGVGKHANLVYVIDFGLSKQFRDSNTHMHNPYQEMLSFIGTAMFASIHSHLGVKLGRRDDLELLTYILIYFLRGSLPWQGLGYLKHNFIVESKQKTSASDLCQGLPAEFHTFLEYSRSLAFNDLPDYRYLSCLFNELLSWEGYQSQQAFDWDIADNQLSGESDNRRHKRNRCHERRTG
jgi:serine/threonine protein kinase